MALRLNLLFYCEITLGDIHFYALAYGVIYKITRNKLDSGCMRLQNVASYFALKNNFQKKQTKYKANAEQCVAYAYFKKEN